MLEKIVEIAVEEDAVGEMLEVAEAAEGEDGEERAVGEAEAGEVAVGERIAGSALEK